MLLSLYDILDIYVIYDLSYMTYETNTICQYGCQKFCYDLNNETSTSKLSKVHFNILNLKSKKLSDFLYIFWNFLCILNLLCGDSKQCRKTLKIHKYLYYTIYPDTFLFHIVWMKNKKVWTP